MLARSHSVIAMCRVWQEPKPLEDPVAAIQGRIAELIAKLHGDRCPRPSLAAAHVPRIEPRLHHPDLRTQLRKVARTYGLVVH